MGSKPANGEPTASMESLDQMRSLPSIASLFQSRRHESDGFQNPEPQTLGVLVADVSGSMADELGEIACALKNGLRFLASDTMTAARIEIAIVAVGGDVRVMQPFQNVAECKVPSFEAGGNTPLAEGVLKSLELIIERRAHHFANDRDVHPAFCLSLTDGKATDSNETVESAMNAIREAEAERIAACFAAATLTADLERLKAMFVRKPLRIDSAEFGPMIKWWIGSLSTTSRSAVGDRVKLDRPPGWSSL